MPGRPSRVTGRPSRPSRVDGRLPSRVDGLSGHSVWLFCLAILSKLSAAPAPFPERKGHAPTPILPNPLSSSIKTWSRGPGCRQHDTLHVHPELQMIITYGLSRTFADSSANRFWDRTLSKRNVLSLSTRNRVHARNQGINAQLHLCIWG